MYQKMYQEVMKKQLEHLVAEHKAKTSGETETDETTIQEGQD
jgi:predicted small metal-binding protein